MVANLISSAKQKFKQTGGRDLIWYIFVLIMLATTWSGAKAVQSNYELQKKISRLQQENEVLSLQNQNIALNNKYLQSDQYLDIAARQNLGLAAPGEQVLLLPSSVAMKYVSQTATSTNAKQASQAQPPSRYVQNLEDWRDFLLGRTILSN